MLTSNPLNPTECCWTCLQTPACKGFALSSVFGICYLKSTNKVGNALASGTVAYYLPAAASPPPSTPPPMALPTPPPPPLGPGETWADYDVAIEQFFQSLPSVLIDAAATNMIVAELANATGIEASRFVVVANQITSISAAWGRALTIDVPMVHYRNLEELVKIRTEVSTANCDTMQNVAFVRIGLITASLAEVELLRQAVRTRNGILDSILNGDGNPLNECGPAAIDVDRPINPAPLPPSPDKASPPPPPQAPTSNLAFYTSILLVLGLIVLSIIMCNTRPARTEVVLRQLVDGNTPDLQKPLVADSKPEGKPLLASAAYTVKMR